MDLICANFPTTLQLNILMFISLKGGNPMKFKAIISTLSLYFVLLSTCMFSFALPLNTNLNKLNLSASPLGIVTRHNVIVVIDPGHGGKDPGALYNGVSEKFLNLDIAMKLGKKLEEVGVTVLYTRKTDISVGLGERADFANKAKADLFVSIHNNSLPSKLSYGGSETLYTITPADNEKRYKINSIGLATILQNEMVSTLKTTNRGLIYRPNLAVLRRTNMPSVITEIAYMTNKNNLVQLNNPVFRQKAASSLSLGIVKALVKMGKV